MTSSTIAPTGRMSIPSRPYFILQQGPSFQNDTCTRSPTTKASSMSLSPPGLATYWTSAPTRSHAAISAS